MDYTVKIVMIGASVLGAVAGALGSLAVLRKQSLLGDSISHAALPGIVLAFMVFASKAPLVLLLGASLAGVLGTWLIMLIIRTTKIQTDAAQGVVLSVFFGLGLLLLSSLKTSGNAHQAGLEKFIFGQAAALLPEDVYLMIVFGLMSFIVLTLFWKHIKSMTFDVSFAQTMGFSRNVTDLIVTSLLVSAIVIGLQTVGVILMSAMIVAPAAAARQWTRGLFSMVVLASIIGAITGLAGALVSSSLVNVPTGPTISILLTVVVVLSLILAPGRGIISRAIRRVRARYTISRNSLLLHLYELETKHQPESRGHGLATIRAMEQSEGSALRVLKDLKKQGFAEIMDQARWRITKNGIEQAKSLLQEVGHGF